MGIRWASFALTEFEPYDYRTPRSQDGDPLRSICELAHMDATATTGMGVMTRKIKGSLVLAALCGLFPLACQSSGVGDPCVPEDEYNTEFNGFDPAEVNVESKSFQCETRVCLVNHFRGRVSCKYGQDVDAMGMPTGQKVCCVPGQYDSTTHQCAPSADPSAPNKIAVAVNAQVQNRKSEDTVYCSCRCDGPEANARYCKCPSGYACTHLVDDLKLPGGQLAGSYCVKDGTQYNSKDLQNTCVATEPHGDDGIGSDGCGQSKR
jgi:hypothetical protein